MVKHKKISHKLNEEFPWNNKTIGHFFLGVGFILFILNITTMLQIAQYVDNGLSMNGYYTSTLSSLFLMGYSLFNIYSK